MITATAMTSRPISCMSSGRHLRSVAFVGVDGSGKSTQARVLRDLLATRGNRVYLVHPYGRKFLPAGFSGSGDAGGDAGRDVVRRPEPGSSRLQRIPKAVVAAVDLLEIGVYLWVAYARARLAALVESGREVWLIGDRSLDDVLVKHVRRGTFSWRVASSLRRLFPVFDTTIWLDLRPEIALLRDRDFPLPYYEGFRETYSAAARRFGWLKITDRRRAPGRYNLPERRVSDLGPPREYVTERAKAELGIE